MSARTWRGATTVAIALSAVIAREGGAQAANTVTSGTWDVRATVGRVEHRVDAGFGVGTSKGTVLGVAARLRRWSAVDIDAHAWGGRLDADEIAGDDRKVGEVGVQASVPAMPWLALVASATVRGVDAAPAVQRWTQLGAGAELRYGFADGLLQSIVHASLLPRVSVSGGADPDIGVRSGAALRLEHGRLHAVLAYSVERYGFPTESSAASRHEQMSGLQLGIGARW